MACFFTMRAADLEHLQDGMATFFPRMTLETSDPKATRAKS